MTKLALLALLVPLAAAAEDDVPVEEAPVEAPVDGPITTPAQLSATTTTTTTTGPTGTTTTTTTTTAPGAVAPIAPVAPIVAAAEEDPCGAYRHAKWRHRMKGRLSIGFSKSHVEMEDESEGKQKSFVARLNGRRGWAIELELSRLTLDGGDTAKTGGVSLVKTFGRRKLAPYVLAGGGGGKYETVDGIEERMRFGEIGAGVMLRGKRFSIGIDMRRGVRGFKDRDDAMDGIERGTTTPAGDDEDRERYTRGRILALVTF